MAAEANKCSYECETDDDCSVIQVDAPPDTTLKCNSLTKACEDPTKVCETQDNCVPSGSYWFMNCESDAECFEGEACVSWEGVGWCASLPTDDVCFLAGAPEPLPRLGAQGTIDVCVAHSWLCGEQGGKVECFPGCSEEEGCGSGNGDTCNLETGLCECETGAECAGKACIDGRCAQCATNQDCAVTAGATGADICVDGQCGCSGANKCPVVPFKGATAVCE